MIKNDVFGTINIVSNLKKDAQWNTFKTKSGKSVNFSVTYLDKLGRVNETRKFAR